MTSSQHQAEAYLNFPLTDNIYGSIRQLILSYLLYNCHEETAFAFARAISYGDSTSSKSAKLSNSGAAPAELSSASYEIQWKSLIEDSLLEGQNVKEGQNAGENTLMAVDAEGDVEMEDATLSSTAQATTTSSAAKISGSSKSKTAGKGSASSSTSTKTDPLNDPVILEMIKSISHRKKDIMSFIRNGQVESAIAKCRLLFPGVAPPIEQIKVDQEEEGKPVNPLDPISVSFQLHCLQFIELVRNNKPTEALTYAQEYLSEFGKKRSVFLEPLREVVALIAYQNPEKSPIGHFLLQEHRNQVAEIINTAILNSTISGPALIKIVQHAVVARHFLTDFGTSQKDKKSSSSIKSLRLTEYFSLD